MAGLSAENQLRDVYNMRIVSNLAQRIKGVYAEFDEQGFCRAIEADLEGLGFGERSSLIRNALKNHLPNDFERSAQKLMDSLEPELDDQPGETPWDGFIVVPETEYIAQEGIDHFNLGMEALKEMTKRFSSEGAIRTFIERYPEESLALLRVWVADPNVHVRRLVSEGTRPRLSLAAPLHSFKNDPGPVLELLEMQKDDPELYVRRSVANNLNDISKDNPAIVVSTLQEWSQDDSEERQWLTRHALRTLLKQGNEDALGLLGYLAPGITDAELELEDGWVPREGDLEFVFKFVSERAQKLMIDYRIHYMKSNGKQAPKTFKWSIRDVGAGDSVVIARKQSFKTISTRKHYPGSHRVEVVVNGHTMAEAEFVCD